MLVAFLVTILSSVLTTQSESHFIIAQWENVCISPSALPVARVQFPAGWSISKDFSLGKWFQLPL